MELKQSVASRVSTKTNVPMKRNAFGSLDRANLAAYPVHHGDARGCFGQLRRSPRV